MEISSEKKVNKKNEIEKEANLLKQIDFNINQEDIKNTNNELDLINIKKIILILKRINPLI